MQNLVPICRVPMYAEMKLALFIYLWYPKTKVSKEFLFISFSYALFVAAAVLLMLNSVCTGDWSCVWKLIKALHVKARDRYWQEYTRIQSQSLGFTHLLLAKLHWAGTIYIPSNGSLPYLSSWQASTTQFRPRGTQKIIPFFIFNSIGSDTMIEL